MIRLARTWLFLAALGAALFLASWTLRPIDEPVGRALVGSPALVELADAMSMLGSFPVLTPLVALAIVTLCVLERWWGALRLLAVPVVAEGVTLLLKVLYARPRPDFRLVEEIGHSFPSGHATAAAAFSVLLLWFATRNLRGRPLLVAAAAFSLLWASGMALSRMVLGVHYLSDVVAGVGVGMACAGGLLAGTFEIERRVRGRALRRAGERHPRARGTA